jgi:hypothetical protein
LPHRLSRFDQPRSRAPRLPSARDIETGEPRYIGEIDADHRGGKCGCECPSCRLALIAVNAAKYKVIKRPHFRHPEGAQRDECAILAARAVAMRLLAEEGVIDLPRRRMSASAEGLSGAIHEAWVEAPAQKVRVLNPFSLNFVPILI